MSVYQYVRSSPSTLTDAFGLIWKITRLGNATALAFACDDTVENLAAIVGLDADSFMEWLAVDPRRAIAGSTKMPARKTDSIPSGAYVIPNTVVAYWAGEYKGMGKALVNWNESLDYLSARGFKVEDIDHIKGSNTVLQKRLEDLSKEKSLHGLYFWGHGFEPYPSVGLTNDSGDVILLYADIKLAYKIALGLVFACDSNSGKASLVGSDRKGMVWHGYTGTLVPVPRTYDVSQWLKPEDQGTRKDTK